jgi:hypothetical protein
MAAQSAARGLNALVAGSALPVGGLQVVSLSLVLVIFMMNAYLEELLKTCILYLSALDVMINLLKLLNYE